MDWDNPTPEQVAKLAAWMKATEPREDFTKGPPRAAKGPFPFLNHRTMRQIMREERV